jgi:FkbM family methyltransferase
MPRGRKVFLDVGGHTGETLAEVMRARWSFDRIWSFEPVPSCVEVLRAMADERVEVVAAGWWSANEQKDLWNPGGLNASVQYEGDGPTLTCDFIDAADWLTEHISPDDEVWAKLNIEGAEVAVLDHLLDQECIGLIDHLLVHFDIEWTGEKDEANRLRSRLDGSGIQWDEAGRVMFGRDRAAKTASWLDWSITRSRRRLWTRALEHRARALAWRLRKRWRGDQADGPVAPTS